MNKTELLNKCARSGEERVLLARALDKLELAQNRSVPACTPFLSPGEQASVTDLLNAWGRPRHLFFGGYEGAERAVCAFLPDWQEESDFLADPEGPVAALEAAFPADAELSHRDILGALMGLGITREKLGDILLDHGRCQVLVLRDALPILLSQWESAGRWKMKLREIPLEQLEAKPPQVKTIRDTVAALRLDAVLAAGFSTSRSKAADLVSAGRVSVNHRECAKADRTVGEGDVLSCRGLGKCVVKEVLGQSKKGRFMLVLERYILRRRYAMITQEKIDRINALARKAKTPEGLTAEETAERAALRQEYVAAVRANLEAQLDNTLIQEPDGTRHRLPKKP